MGIFADLSGGLAVDRHVRRRAEGQPALQRRSFSRGQSRSSSPMSCRVSIPVRRVESRGEEADGDDADRRLRLLAGSQRPRETDSCSTTGSLRGQKHPGTARLVSADPARAACALLRPGLAHHRSGGASLLSSTPRRRLLATAPPDPRVQHHNLATTFYDAWLAAPSPPEPVEAAHTSPTVSCPPRRRLDPLLYLDTATYRIVRPARSSKHFSAGN